MTETQSPNVEINNYTLRDVSIKKALVTPEDDAGIEVLLNMRSAVFSGDGSWWDFNVSSIDQDGITTDHMTGSISVNAKVHRPAPRPKAVLNQKASGKEWNQALRSVGFDYGLVFADMTDIGFNGRDFLCTCKTQVKQTSGTISGESRHVLHPGTVDSSLQLMIASIYAGRTKAMAAAIAPVQVDEVCIWPPAASELGDGLVTAWTDERGTRSFVCGNELVSRDGRVLMQMRNMRGTLYEAAVPQSGGAALKPMPYAEMVWKKDVDALDRVDSAGVLVELAAFKKPGIKVLDIGGAHATELLRTDPYLHYVATSEAAAPEGLLECYRNAEWKLVNPGQSLTEQGLAEGSFDVVLSDGVSTSSNLVCRGGRLFVAAGQGFGSVVSRKADKPHDSGTEVQLLYRQVDAGHLKEIQR
jgi:hypothetical protein